VVTAATDIWGHYDGGGGDNGESGDDDDDDSGICTFDIFARWRVRPDGAAPYLLIAVVWVFMVVSDAGMVVGGVCKRERDEREREREREREIKGGRERERRKRNREELIVNKTEGRGRGGEGGRNYWHCAHLCGWRGRFHCSVAVLVEAHAESR
jgi:hypothetical protein